MPWNEKGRGCVDRFLYPEDETKRVRGRCAGLGKEKDGDGKIMKKGRENYTWLR